MKSVFMALVEFNTVRINAHATRRFDINGCCYIFERSLVEYRVQHIFCKKMHLKLRFELGELPDEKEIPLSSTKLRSNAQHSFIRGAFFVESFLFLTIRMFDCVRRVR